MTNIYEQYKVAVKDRGFIRLYTLYSRAFTIMCETPFKVLINGDNNRVKDVIAQREDCNIKTDLEPSVFEVLFSLIDRAVYIDGGLTHTAWWSMFIKNLGLTEYIDECFDAKIVKAVVDRFNFREYGRTGNGNVFKFGDRIDVRHQELWYQMQHFISNM